MGGCKETVFKDAKNEEKCVANLIKMQNNFEKKKYIVTIIMKRL